jgi:hypothetical protein
MDARLRIVTLSSCAAAVMLAVTLTGQRAPMTADRTALIVKAAQAVVNSLDDAGKKKVQFAYDDEAQRKRWSNLPGPMVQRDGVRLADLAPSQRDTIMKMLQVALSAEGYRKVVDIMDGDEQLRTRGDGGGKVQFGKDQYWLAFLGTPSTTTPWMLQFGGHHLAINLTIAGNSAAMTPSLPAAQPAKFTIEGRTVRPLGDENDKAFALINALDSTQQGQAILASRVADLVLGPGNDGKTIQPEGLKVSAMTAAQQNMLWDIVHEWSGIEADDYAGPRLTEIKSHPNDTYFAWSGPTTNGSASYYRIQGPTLVIEYAPQQGSVDHIHTIYRDPTNDYGAKIAKR